MSRFALAAITLLALVPAVTAPSAEAAVFRVSTAGNNSNDGSTWLLAKRTVQSAIDAAGSGDEVWVKAGTYVQPGGIVHKSGVGLYGGFAGTESTLEDRPAFPRPQPDEHETILDGNRAVTVVTVPQNALEATVVDGFTIRKDVWGVDCKSGATPVIEHNVISTCSSGGIIAYNTGGSIRWNLISNEDVGFGVYCSGTNCPVVAHNEISRCATGILARPDAGQVVSNKISASKSGLYAEGPAGLVVQENLVSGCTGIAVECWGAPSVWRNLIFHNHGSSALNTHGYSLVEGNVVVANNGSAAAVFCSSGTAVLRNNIVCYNDTSGIRGASGSLPWLNNNCVFGNYPQDYYDLQPGYEDISADPMFVDYASRDFRLRPGSPCIDTGDEFSPLDPDGSRADIGAFPYFHLGAAKSATGQVVSLTSLVCTAASEEVSGRAYVQDLATPSGIWVQTAQPMERGSTYDVTGLLEVEELSGECRLVSASAVETTSEEPPVPMFLPNKALGGSGFGLQQGVLHGRGLNNIGLLVRSVGRVTSVDDGGGFFTLTDASCWDFRTKPTDAAGIEGVRVCTDSINSPALASGDFVAVEGISSCMKVGDTLYPLIRPRDEQDIEIVSLSN